MGNLFLGFPVSRAKIADQIATTAAPSAHHTQHENGGSDEIDVTGLVGAGGGGGGVGALISYQSNIDSLDGFYTTSTGSGGVTITSAGATVSSGATADSLGRLKKTTQSLGLHANYGLNRSFFADVWFYSATSATGLLRIATASTASKKHIGFKVLNGILYGTVGNGSAETTVLLQTIDTIAFAAERSLLVIFTAGSKCEFFVDGVLLGTITTGLPSGLSTDYELFWALASNPAVAEIKRIGITSYGITIQR